MANRKRKPAKESVLTFRADRDLIERVKGAVDRDKNMKTTKRQAVEVALRAYLAMIESRQAPG